jgi:hypothetical protein
MLEASLFATLGFTGRRRSNEDLLLLKETLLRFSNVLYVVRQWRMGERMNSYYSLLFRWGEFVPAKKDTAGKGAAPQSICVFVTL